MRTIVKFYGVGLLLLSVILLTSGCQRSRLPSQASGNSFQANRESFQNHIAEYSQLPATVLYVQHDENAPFSAGYIKGKMIVTESDEPAVPTFKLSDMNFNPELNKENLIATTPEEVETIVAILKHGSQSWDIFVVDRSKAAIVGRGYLTSEPLGATTAYKESYRFPEEFIKFVKQLPRQ